MPQVDVSVIIPIRNAESWLEQCIASALACIGVTEVILVDDGSTDRSLAVAERFGSSVRVLQSGGRGGNAARDLGRRAARGDWLQFLDADDYLEPQKICRQIGEANDLDTADILYSPTWIEIWQEDRRIDRTSSPLNTTVDLFTQWITWELPQTGGALWRASALDRIGGWKEDQACCQEHELYLRALQAGLRWVYCPSAGAIYRIWSETTVCRKDPIQVIRTRAGLIERMLTWLEANGHLTEVHREAAAQAYFAMARTWARYDLPAAVGFLEAQQARFRIRPRGAAAPLSYRIVYRLLGFRRAELIAAQLR